MTACSSSSGTRGCSKRALPPPESRNSTVSVGSSPAVISSTAAVPRKLLPSGTGWPASTHRTPGISPRTWPYLVTTIPPSGGWGRTSTAVLAICQAAFPAATKNTRPGKVISPSARRTAASGFTAAMAAPAMASPSILSFSFILFPPLVKCWRRCQQLLCLLLPEVSTFPGKWQGKANRTGNKIFLLP